MQTLIGFRCPRSWSTIEVSNESELRAFGFSYTGRTLIIATSNELVIYRRHR